MHLPILYSFRRCPYAMRARIALICSGTTFYLREINLRDKHPQFLRISPKGTVPVIDEGGRVIEESLDIVDFYSKGIDDSWFKVIDRDPFLVDLSSELIVHVNKYKYPQRYGLQDYTSHMITFLGEMDLMLGEKSFFTSNYCTWFDIAVLPFIRQAEAVDRGFLEKNNLFNLNNFLLFWEKGKYWDLIMRKVDVWEDNEGVLIDPKILG